MNHTRFLILLTTALSAGGAFAQTSNPTNAPATRPATSQVAASTEVMARLRDEGTNRSQIAATFSYLTDVLGARLTASPNCRRANDWTRDKLASWGLTNAHLEPWGPFGRGWSVKRFSAQIIEPQAIPLVAWPKAWSYGTDWPIAAEVVFLEAKTEADLEKFKGKLKGQIALVSSPREIAIRFDPLATRLEETNLLRLANASPSARQGPRPLGREARRPAPTNAPLARSLTNARGASPNTNQAPAVASNQPPARLPRLIDANERLRFAVREGAAATVSISSAGDAGAVWVPNVSLVAPTEGATNRPGPEARAVWATNAPPGPPQIVLSAEQYNRLVNMATNGEKLKMVLEVQTQFHERDLMCYNTIAEMPGTDRREEIVMLGAHLDSAPGGTGATDNAAGVAVVMEAVRLIKALQLQPRRTIRIGLWTGEEQGLLGSKAYVTKQFGYQTNQTNVAVAGSPKSASQRPATMNRPTVVPKLVTHHDYQHFSAYYNLDNGAGRIRGVYLQGNEGLRPMFRRWLEPFQDLGAEPISAANTDGTDHLPFDAVGLPGFQFIQDPIEYWRSYHTTIDVRERAPEADLQQAAIIMAAFVYNTAMLDELLPRKPAVASTTGSR
ncbi:MAG: M20/M25/M40 family metallo-hydrolase [Verrucomicrobia bacterium]|nr:M20/M25/M40 family metallo-hydrolase [Verrucomicrobiota bacterium]